MCVYSLAADDTRQFAAKKGERLVLMHFGHANGFAEIGKPERAVCMREGTVVQITYPAMYDLFATMPSVRAQLSEGDRDESHPSYGVRRRQDALVFEGDVRFDLDSLPNGLIIEVLSVPMEKGAGFEPQALNAVFDDPVERAGVEQTNSTQAVPVLAHV